MNERAKYKLIGFIMMFASSSLMGGIGAFTRFIDAPGDFVSFWRKNPPLQNVGSASAAARVAL